MLNQTQIKILEIKHLKSVSSVERENIHIYVIDVDVNTVYYAIQYDENDNPIEVLIFVPYRIWEEYEDGVIAFGRNVLHETLTEYESKKLNELLDNVEIIDFWNDLELKRYIPEETYYDPFDGKQKTRILYDEICGFDEDNNLQICIKFVFDTGKIIDINIGMCE